MATGFAKDTEVHLITAIEERWAKVFSSLLTAFMVIDDLRILLVSVLTLEPMSIAHFCFLLFWFLILSKPRRVPAVNKAFSRSHKQSGIQEISRGAKNFL